MKSYIVSADLKFPPAYPAGWDFEVFAQNKKEAISKARKMAFREGAFSRQDGPVIYKAKEKLNA